LVLGYSLSAIAVGLLSMLLLGARRIPKFLEQVGLAWPKGGLAALNRAAALGLGMGVLAAAFAAGYLWVIAHIPSLRPYLKAPTLWSEVPRSDWRWLALLVVVGAPICEEYLFRGLLLRSLQRHSGLIRAALVSSVVFALMHPPIACVPVFVLGVAAAVSFGRSRSLLAPVLAHMVYNALLVLAPFLAQQGGSR
jgi:membrane protease YdiL (CAAX protease family)